MTICSVILHNYTLYVFISLVQCYPPINGIVNCPNRATIGVVGDTCTFSCKQGFTLQGPTSVTCLGNQSWSGNPICVGSEGLYSLLLHFNTAKKIVMLQKYHLDGNWLYLRVTNDTTKVEFYCNVL